MSSFTKMVQTDARGYQLLIQGCLIKKNHAVFQDPPWSKCVVGFRRLGKEELKDYPGREQVKSIVLTIN